MRHEQVLIYLFICKIYKLLQPWRILNRIEIQSCVVNANSKVQLHLRNDITLYWKLHILCWHLHLNQVPKEPRFYKAFRVGRGHLCLEEQAIPRRGAWPDNGLFQALSYLSVGRTFKCVSHPFDWVGRVYMGRAILQMPRVWAIYRIL